MKKLSIVTVCYNSAATIEKTIQSVIEQKTNEIEYVIVDGGSTDNTMEIVKKYDDNIDVVISEPDRGISDAFNKGIRVATGEYIGIINSDDHFLPWAFRMFLKEIKEDTDVLYGHGIRLFEDGKCKRYLAESDCNQLHHHMSFCHPATFVRKSAYERWGFFSEEFKCVMDRELLLRMLNGGANFQYSDEFYAVYVMGGVSDKSYLNTVIPEIYKINVRDGMPKHKAIMDGVWNVLCFYLLKFRSNVVGDRKRIAFSDLKSKVDPQI